MLRRNDLFRKCGKEDRSVLAPWIEPHALLDPVSQLAKGFELVAARLLAEERPEALSKALGLAFSGNRRELQRIVERQDVLCDELLCPRNQASQANALIQVRL